MSKNQDNKILIRLVDGAWGGIDLAISEQVFNSGAFNVIVSPEDKFKDGFPDHCYEAKVLVYKPSSTNKLEWVVQ
jgi:hypothetical protein